jgi:hypothetical protein
LRDHWPDLRHEKGSHFAAVLERVFEAQLNRLRAQNSVDATSTPVDKSALAIAAPRRLRDEEHLAFVATLPALSVPGHQPKRIICGSPSRRHWDGRSATSGWFRFATCITARSTTPGT